MSINVYQWDYVIALTSSKRNTLFDYLEYVKTYIYDLLTISKGNWFEHFKHIDVVLQRLKDSGLKVNANNNSLVNLNWNTLAAG
jgi:hypothetical protein